MNFNQFILINAQKFEAFKKERGKSPKIFHLLMTYAKSTEISSFPR